jgi:hypothetical protein
VKKAEGKVACEKRKEKEWRRRALVGPGRNPRFHPGDGIPFSVREMETER